MKSAKLAYKTRDHGKHWGITKRRASYLQRARRHSEIFTKKTCHLHYVFHTSAVQSRHPVPPPPPIHNMYHSSTVPVCSSTITIIGYYSVCSDAHVCLCEITGNKFNQLRSLKYSASLPASNMLKRPLGRVSVTPTVHNFSFIIIT